MTAERDAHHTRGVSHPAENGASKGNGDAMVRPLVTGRVELGHLLQMGMMLVVGIGAFYAVSGRAEKATEKSEMVANQVERLRTDMQTNFNTVSNQITGMPLMAQRVTDNTARTIELASIIEKIAQKLEMIDRAAARAQEISARLENRFDRMEERVGQIDREMNAPVKFRPTR